jgi:methylglutaconyl-CoA hydratase
MIGKFFLFQQDDLGVATITLNRPELHNAFNDEFITELTLACDNLAKSNDVRLVVLAGNGKSFCAGADLNWMKKMISYSDDQNYEDSRALAGLFESINNLPMPVLAKVGGATLGGGTGIIAACDYVISSREAKFGFTEVALGLVPAVISPYVLKKVNESSARAYFLSGERFTAEEAMRINLVHKVVDHDDLESATQKQISRFLNAGPIAAREAKALIKGVLSASPESLTDYTCKTIARLRISPEGQEGMKAILEKRKPAWMGRSK